jgi:hypothetical protein
MTTWFARPLVVFNLIVYLCIRSFMSVLTLEYSFENKLRDINVRKFIFSIIRGRVTSYSENIKKLLAQVDNEFQQEKQILTDIEKLDHSELKLLNKKFKRINSYFDKLNDMYYNENYFGDAELKQIFTSISRQTHKVENLSHKYLYLDHSQSQTPEYIKEALANFSQDAISKKIKIN